MNFIDIFTKKVTDINPMMFNKKTLLKTPAFYHVYDHHTRNGIAYFNVLCCHKTVRKKRDVFI